MSEAKYGLTVFSPQGRLPQIEYAMKAAMKGTTVIGIKASNGVVLAAEKRAMTTLVDLSTIQKIFVLDEHVGCSYSGLGADCRLLVDEGRRYCQVYRLTYQTPVPIGQLARHLAETYQEYTQSGGVRPFGCILLLAGVDELGEHLYKIIPIGYFSCWKAVAIGRGAESACTFLEKRYYHNSNDNNTAELMELEDATHTALLTLKEGFDGQMTSQNTEVGRVVDGKFEVLTIDSLKDYIEQI